MWPGWTHVIQRCSDRSWLPVHLLRLYYQRSISIGRAYSVARSHVYGGPVPESQKARMYVPQKMNRFGLWCQGLFVVLAVVAIGCYVFVALSRIGSPFAIEWLEANSFIHVARVLKAQPIFVAPSFEFIPMVYTPLYYYAAAPFAFLTGRIMLGMRLVSLLSSLGIFACIYVLCRTRQLSRPLSLLGVGLFAASFGVTGFWFDVGRVDSLFVLLMTASYVCVHVRSRHDVALGIISGLLLCLSFLTKQQAVIVFPFLVLLSLLQWRWRRCVATCAAFLVSVVVVVLSMNILSGGWFWFYVYEVPSSVPLIRWMFRDFWSINFLPAYRILLVLILVAVVVGWRTPARNGYLLILVTFLLPALAMSYISLVKNFGYLNALLPSAVALAVAGAEAASILLATNWRGWRGSSRQAVCVVLVVLQFWAMRYDVMAQIPDAAHERLGYAILDDLRRAPAPMFAPTAPYLLYMVGQPTHYQSSSYGDLGAGAPRNAHIKQVMEQYGIESPIFFKDRTFHTVVLPNRDWFDTLYGRDQGYTCHQLGSDDGRLHPMTGAASYVERICRDR